MYNDSNVCSLQEGCVKLHVNMNDGSQHDITVACFWSFGKITSYFCVDI
jgi:hypothetical protein